MNVEEIKNNKEMKEIIHQIGLEKIVGKKIGKIIIPKRPINEIAGEIRKSWKNIYFGAKPYLDAMDFLTNIDDVYGIEQASSIINYFLSNASSWRGDDARRIKLELNNLLK